MKKGVFKTSCIIMLALLANNLFGFATHASGFGGSGSARADAVVLEIGVGSGKGEVGYSEGMGGGGSGPEAFTVTKDGAIYVVDNVNKRVNIYQEGKFVSDIDAPYIAYVRSIVVSQGAIYLMDYDAGKIYVVDASGTLAKEIALPPDMDSYFMRKLYASGDGRVWLLYEDNWRENASRGTDFSYAISDLSNGYGKAYAEGWVWSNNDTYSVLYTSPNSATITNSNIKVATSELLAELKILAADEKGTLYIDLYEQTDTSIVAGEYTVRKFLGGECLGVSSIDLKDYYFMPNNVVEISETGELYQIKCGRSSVQIIRKEFIPIDDFATCIAEIKSEAMAADLANGGSPVSRANAPNNKTVTSNNASACISQTWTYSSSNTVNPDSANVTKPPYLSSTTPSSQIGIPYCWGGFDGITTSSSPSVWTDFVDAMSKGKFAGNVNTSTVGWQSGTAGLDCSGFISSVAGFSSKLSTVNLASSTYTASVSAGNRSTYDIYVKSGSHALFYVGTASGGINTRESTTSGDAKTKDYSRSTSFLTNYSLRRLNGW
jgi:uncharacterized protein YraI